MLGVNHSVRSPNRTGTDALIRDYDFIRKDKLHQDIEFDRDSGATQTNSSGLVAFARNNLHAHSTGVNATTFSGLNMEALDANFATAPDGTTTAARARPTSATARHELNVFYDSVANSIYSSSIYVKPLGSITHIAFTWAGASSIKVVFDIVNGTSGSTGGDILGKSITHVGDGWMRMNIVFKSVFTGNTKNYLSLGEADSSNSTYSNVAGDGTKGILYWGAQTEQILSAQDDPLELIHTDGKAYQAPRFDYTKDGDKKGLLIEEQRTNLFKYTDLSNSTQNGWDWLVSGSGTTVTNAAIDPTGGKNAIKIIANTNNTLKLFRANSVPTNSVGTEYCMSIYVKDAGTRYFNFYLNDSGAKMLKVDLQTGQVDSFTGTGNYGVEEVGNDWYRVWFSHSVVVNVDAIYMVPSLASYATTFAGDGSNGVFVWGAQFEQGSFPSSLIPNFGTSSGVTRSADLASVSGTNFSRFFKDTEGTTVVDVQLPKGWEDTDFNRFYAFSDGTFNNSIQAWINASATQEPRGQVKTGGVDQGSIVAKFIKLNTGEITRLGQVYKTNDHQVFIDGAVGSSDTTVSLPTNLNTLNIGSGPSGASRLSGWIRRLRYFNKKKTNTQVQKLTDTSFLLDKFKGAKAAHSLRSLRDGRDNSPVTRIRREYDSFEADYTANQVANGDLEKDFRSADQKTLPLNISCEADEMIVGGDFTNLVTNGTFDTDTSGWAAGGGATLAVDSNRLKITNDASGNSYASQTLTTVVGRTYTVFVEYTDDTGSNALIWAGTSFGGNQLGSTSFTATGNYTLTFTATSTTSYLRIGANEPTNGTIYFFDNVSVVEGSWGATTLSTWEFSDGLLIKSGIGSRMTQQVPTVKGKQYKVVAEISGHSNGQASIYFEGSYSSNISSAGILEYTGVATDNSTQIGIYGNSGSSFSVDSISVKEVNPIATGFSTRKINSSYTGYAMRVRNFDDSTEAEVSFDSNDEISLDSPVKATSMNLVGHSENFGSWVASSVDLTSGQSDPFGGNNAYIIKSQSAGSNQAYLGSISLTSGNYYTLSVYLKPLDTTRTRIFVGGGGATNQGFDVSFSSLGVPSTVSSTGATNITYTPVGTDGWYRVSGVIKSDATTSNSLFIIYPDYSGNTKSVYAFGAQLEETVYESTGTELVTNGDFSTSDSSANGIADWLTTSGAGIPDDGTGTTLVNGKLRFDNTMATGTSSDFLQIFQRVDVVAGRKYSFSGDFDILDGTISGGGVNAILLEDSSPFASRVNFGPATADGTVTGDHVATITETVRMRLDRKFVNGGTDNDVVADIDNISLVEYSPKVSDYVQTPVISDAHNSTSATNLREFAGKENLLDYSEDFSSGKWTPLGSMTVSSASNITDPFGGTNSTKIVAPTGSGLKLIGPATIPSVSSGTTVTASLYVKNAGGRYVIFYLNDSTSRMLRVDLQTGTITSNTADSGTIEALDDDWYRISFTRTLDTNLGGVFVSPSLDGQNVSFAGNGTDGLYIFGAQLNTNSLKDYQKTSGTAKTADVHVVNWYDQGGGEDFTQSTTDYQPRIVMGSELVTDSGGKASVYFDDTAHLENDSLAGHNRLDSYYLTDSTDDIYALPAGNSGSYVGALFDDGATSNDWYLSAYGTADSKIHINGTELSGTSRDDLHDQSKGHSLVTHENVYTKSWPNFEVGVWTAGSAYNFTGKISEMVFFPNMDSSPKRFPIEQNMMNHYIPNLLTNGDFSDGLTGWVAGGDSSLISVENGAIRINSPDSIFTQIYQTVPVTLGRKYVITADLVVTSGGVAIGANHNSAATEVTYTSSGSISQSFVATTTSSSNTIYIKRSGASNVLIDNVKVQEVGTSGYVTTLYDQTGNNNHALQATASIQPQLVSGGDLIKSGGHPAWEFIEDSSGNTSNLNLHGKIQVAHLDAWFVHDTSDTAFLYPSHVGSYGWVAQQGNTNTSMFINYGGGDSKLYVNNSLAAETGGAYNRGDVYTALVGRKLAHHQDAFTQDWTAMDVGRYNNFPNNGFNFVGKMSEMIWYDSDQSSNRTAIDTAINTHYNIYS